MILFSSIMLGTTLTIDASQQHNIIIHTIQTFGQLAKYTSAMYSELTVEEKEAWLQRAEADKSRYLYELSLYVPPAGYDMKGELIDYEEEQAIKPIRMVGGKSRDPNAPKRSEWIGYYGLENMQHKQT